MKRILFSLLILLFCFCATAQIPQGYYDSAEGKKQAALKTALFDIIKIHETLTYGSLWEHFKTTDKKQDGKVWDMYSDCDFTFSADQCGNYSSICDCYNREHSFPKSWFGDVAPMNTDLFHLYPTDGKVNGYRGNFPFGEVAAGNTYGTGKLGGAKADLGYNGTVFEPADEYKGDFARTYFYMVTCYEDKVASWTNNAEARPTLNGTKFPAFNPWQLTMLLNWHKNDPVSQKEIDRNNAVYAIQNNRNPFIDKPEYVDYIWGDDDGDSDGDSVVLSIAGNAWLDEILLSPNPASSLLSLVFPSDLSVKDMELFDLSGYSYMKIRGAASEIQVAQLPGGLYFLRIRTSAGETTKKFIKQ